ncbi:hypothetical protein [Ferroacidibacillus organovorans]|uniref:Gram-positive cocci surface proteins LPxTG domain-containing protein n=1 Tax=Ferroacidibacillus organovorans TaxID=1765683 RepID=A0A101XQF0_9BACL|nr:hypothetical protein [Ferroacidibacillus organovorans]KUO95669.1 hypothetical protein ATW55_04270 [Ferroacidibacillus organovorans]
MKLNRAQCLAGITLTALMTLSVTGVAFAKGSDHGGHHEGQDGRSQQVDHQNGKQHQEDGNKHGDRDKGKGDDRRSLQLDWFTKPAGAILADTQDRAIGETLSAAAQGCDASLSVPRGAWSHRGTIALTTVDWSLRSVQLPSGFHVIGSCGVRLAGTVSAKPLILHLQHLQANAGAAVYAIVGQNLARLPVTIRNGQCDITLAPGVTSLDVLVLQPSINASRAPHEQVQWRSVTKVVGEEDVTVQLPATIPGAVTITSSAQTALALREFIPAGEALAGNFIVQLPPAAVNHAFLRLTERGYPQGSAVYQVTPSGLRYVTPVATHGVTALPHTEENQRMSYVILKPTHVVTAATTPVTGLPILPEAGAGTLFIGAGIGLLLAGNKKRNTR